MPKHPPKSLNRAGKKNKLRIMNYELRNFCKGQDDSEIVISKFLDTILKVRVQQVRETYNLKRHPETKWGIPKT